MFRSTRFPKMRRYAKVGVVLALGLTLTTTITQPTYAHDDAAVAAGIVGGTALGLLAFGAAADAYGPPPPPPYGVEPVDAGPGDIGPPPPCHDVMVESFDPYAGAYVETPRHVCGDY